MSCLASSRRASRASRRRGTTLFGGLAIAATISVPASAAARPVVSASAQVLRAVSASVQVRSLPTRPAPSIPPGDETITSSVDASGYHLFAASAGDGWRWHPLATLLPGGYDDQPWTGEQCLTGDGRFVVAVIAPWSASNSEAGINHGGIAYAIDAHTGAIRPLASGVAPVYFNPGCGTGSRVALTGYAGPNQRPTVISVVDAASGSMMRTTTSGGELTSAEVVGDHIVAAEGDRLVDVTSGQATNLSVFPGQVAEIRPAADGGLDLLAEGPQRAQVWHWTTHAARMLGSGPAQDVHLFEGSGGHNLVTGVRGSLVAGAGLRVVAGGSQVAAISLSGNATQLVYHAAFPVKGGLGTHVSLVVAGSSAVRRSTLATGTRSADTSLPRTALVASIPRGAVRAARAKAVSPAVVNDTPACAVPRDDIFKQAMQPAANQIRWAVVQAVQGGLTGPRPTSQLDPNYALHDSNYAPLQQAAPSNDFPLVSGAPTVPPLVVFGILAQESNWSQASWHSLPGRAGNPLIANYYGNGGDTTLPIDYSQADCGYGLGQLTDIMKMGSSGTPTAQQVRVAVDYATNVAAVVQALQTKWVQLHQLKITLNNDDPTKIENWYAAIWAYNSGVHMTAAGDPANGLGWLNNPANPIYPFPRHTFLHEGTITTLDDAKTPNHWPYQERVFGWMEVPQLNGNGFLKYRGTYDWDTNTGTFLNTPSAAWFCSPTVNNCDPNKLGDGTSNDPCPAEDSSCWWDQPVTWVNCATSCITDTPTNAPNGHTYYSPPGTPEPAPQWDGYPAPTAACTPPSPGTGAIVVGDEILDPSKNPDQLTPNLMGCPLSNPALTPPASANASFQLLDASNSDALTTPSSLAAVDLHQIGAGAGGHTFFTHTGAVPGVGQPDPEVRGQWNVTLPADSNVGTVYEIKPFIPDTAATSGHATYEISVSGCSTSPCPGSQQTPYGTLRRTINQAAYTNQWASLGYYLCPAGGCTMTVTAHSTSPSSDTTIGADIAFNAMAFVPVPTGGYVALGDSYSSGEGVAGTDGGLATYDDGTDVQQNLPQYGNYTGDNGDWCHRSALSWPRLLAAAKSIPIIDLACSGSNLGDLVGSTYWFNEQVTQNYLAGLIPDGFLTTFLHDGQLYGADVNGQSLDPWSDNLHTSIPNPDFAGSAYYGEPSYQLDLLRALRPRLVTLTAGGNDLGFADIVQTCFLLSDCRGNFTTSNPAQDLVDNRINSLIPFLREAYSDVTAAAGSQANVYVLTYPSAISDDMDVSDSNPSGTDCSGLSQTNRDWLYPKVAELAGAIKEAAVGTTVQVIDISTLFSGNDMCAATPYATAPDLNLIKQGQLSGTPVIDNWFHPNIAGYAAIEQYIVNKISVP